jgi:hypothetical protein
MVAADVALVATERPDRIKRTFPDCPADLVVEVASEGSRGADEATSAASMRPTAFPSAGSLIPSVGLLSRQPPESFCQTGVRTSWSAAYHGEAHRMCSSVRSSPSGVSTRRISANARSGSATVHIASETTTVSKETARNGSAAASAATVLTGNETGRALATARPSMAGPASDRTTPDASR